MLGGKGDIGPVGPIPQRSTDGEISSEKLQDNSCPTTTSNDRYVACNVLAEKGLSSVIWLEDLLVLHGSDTQVWDLNLLVQEPRAAADVLLQAGYKETPPNSRFDDDPEFSERAIRIVLSPSSTGVVLHPAQDWHYDLNESVQNFLPRLHKFLDSIIEFWLNISSRDYVDRLLFALYIGCLINYCYYLKDENGEPVKDPAYAKNLKPEHREVHYDIVAKDPKMESFTTTNRHQYHARRSREIKDGLFNPEPYQEGVFRAPLTTLSE